MGRDLEKKREYDRKRWQDKKDYCSKTHAEWRKNNLEQRAEAQRKANRKKWDYIDSHKPETCPSCDNSLPPYCMDFHHIDPSKKSFQLAQATHKSYAMIDEEIKKCVVLCACCHRKLHKGDITLDY
jgi:hypothetical protein